MRQEDLHTCSCKAAGTPVSTGSGCRSNAHGPPTGMLTVDTDAMPPVPCPPLFSPCPCPGIPQTYLHTGHIKHTTAAVQHHQEEGKSKLLLLLRIQGIVAVFGLFAFESTGLYHPLFTPVVLHHTFHAGFQTTSSPEEGHPILDDGLEPQVRRHRTTKCASRDACFHYQISTQPFHGLAYRPSRRRVPSRVSLIHRDFGDGGHKA